MDTFLNLLGTLKKRRTWFRFLAGCVFIYLLAMFVIIVDGVTDSAKKSDVIIVLGNQVMDDGTPSDRLAARLNAAYSAYKRDLAPYIIVSGGIGESGFDEAEVMGEYLVAKGIPETRIIYDSKGINTKATARNSAKIMEDKGWEKAIVATQFYHVPRTRLAHKRAGIKQVSTIHPSFFERRDLYSLFREVPAYTKYWIKL